MFNSFNRKCTAYDLTERLVFCEAHIVLIKFCRGYSLSTSNFYNPSLGNIPSVNQALRLPSKTKVQKQ